MAMDVTDLRCEYRLNPLGIDSLRPRLSWKLDSSLRGALQQAFQVEAASSEESLGNPEALLWDSGAVDSNQSLHNPYKGPDLQSRQRVYWRVRVWDETNQPTEWSNTAWFEMGLLNQEDWRAGWIGNPIVGGPRTSVPCPFFRKDFSIDGDYQSANLYITALGIYEAFINGKRVGEDLFSPGWTDYSQRLQYQTYDVSHLLKDGSNTLGAILGDGWYCGHVAWQGRQLYGDRPKLLAQLEIIHSDSSTQIVSTDETWSTAIGPLLEADLIMGESYDARLEIPGWNLPDLPAASHSFPNPWTAAMKFPHPEDLMLVAQNTPTVRAQGELAPITEPSIIWGWPDHDWIFDFGQNLVGRVRLKVKGERGETITLRFGEMLDARDRLYTDNLRTARQTDYYTLKGDPDGETYESRFTFHGFRYVQVNGLSAQPARDALTAIVLHSENPPSLEFECSDPLLNQLQHNIEWGWKGNSIDVPSDCPQRDERLGWTGDAQVFARTATYLTDAASFLSKWVQDMADAQLDSGAIPATAPVPPMLQNFDGGAAWSDAFIIVPWTIWQQYGDTRILETHYEAMSSYMDYLVENSPGLIRLLPNESELSESNEDWLIGGFGDWLAQDGNADRLGLTPKDLLGTAFLAYDAQLMSQIAAALDKHGQAVKFEQLFLDTRAAFVEQFINPSGSMPAGTQTGYVLALHFDLVPEELRPSIISSLVQDIENTRKMHISTGFVGTPYISQVLTDMGRVDLAYALLFQKSFPSWLYSVLHGATTIWERWDGWTEEHGFQDASMNSFNHYANGAVGAWMYENISGIQTDPTAPGFKHIILRPRIPANPLGTGGDGLTYARGEYQSMYGKIVSHWRIDEDDLIWEVKVPPNSTASAHIPAVNKARIFEGEADIDRCSGVKFIHRTDEAAVYKLQSGTYKFTVRQ
jgi:alpha-L-rhamnosidase